jgi:hypothetical protein
MDKKEISVSFKMKNQLDDEYTLYDDGSVLHEYDRNIYPGGQNLKTNLTVKDLSDAVKQRLLEAASKNNKELVRKILNQVSE